MSERGIIRKSAHWPKITRGGAFSPKKTTPIASCSLPAPLGGAFFLCYISRQSCARRRGGISSPNEEETMTEKENRGTNAHNQRCYGNTGWPGNHSNQPACAMHCENENCGFCYAANACDVHERKCPKCQGGVACSCAKCPVKGKGKSGGCPECRRICCAD